MFSVKTIPSSQTCACTSLRTTLCLQYSAQQIAFALVFLSLIIMGLKPAAPTTNASNSSGGGGGSGNRYGANSNSSSNIGAHSDVSWLDIFEKDVDENVLQSKKHE